MYELLTIISAFMTVLLGYVFLATFSFGSILALIISWSRNARYVGQFFMAGSVGYMSFITAFDSEKGLNFHSELPICTESLFPRNFKIS